MSRLHELCPRCGCNITFEVCWKDINIDAIHDTQVLSRAGRHGKRVAEAETR